MFCFKDPYKTQLKAMLMAYCANRVNTLNGNTVATAK